MWKLKERKTKIFEAKNSLSLVPLNFRKWCGQTVGKS